jgi:hypothetical protein
LRPAVPRLRDSPPLVPAPLSLESSALADVLLSSGGPVVSPLLSVVDCDVSTAVLAEASLSSPPPEVCAPLSFWAVVTEVPSIPVQPLAKSNVQPTHQRMPPG